MEKILIIEDEESILMALTDDLGLEGYEIETATDGLKGLEIAKEKGYDLIILDIMLPKMDGFELCRQLRQAGVRTPILMLTAKSQEIDKVLGLELGADDYVTKPFSPRELRARIKAVLRRDEEEGPEVYRFHDCEVDFDRGELRRGGKPVEATPLEFKLLSAFIRRRGKVLSRDQLIEAAWGRGIFVTERAVDYHVLNLRRKIEPVPGAPRFLQSVRGMGYRFDG